MASSDKQKKKKRQEPATSPTAGERQGVGPAGHSGPESPAGRRSGLPTGPTTRRRGGDETDGTPSQLGATKYVHAAFFAAAILVAFLAGKMLTSVWNRLAEWPAAVRSLPQLCCATVRASAATFGMVGGVLVGGIVLWQIYRRRNIRDWADEVAIELSQVTWPTRER